MKKANKNKTAFKACSAAQYNFYFIWLIGIGYNSDTAIMVSKDYVMRVNTLYPPFLKIQQVQTFMRVI